MANDIPGTVTEVDTVVEKLPTKIKHPLDPLTPDEIVAVSLAVRHHIATNTDIKAIKFITSYLVPPPKRAVLAALKIPLEPGGKPEEPTPIVRKAESDLLDVVNGRSYNAQVSYHNNAKWVVDSINLLPAGVQPQISVQELIDCEKVVKKDPKVQKLAKDIGVEPHEIFCDGWSIGYDTRFPQQRRVQQALMFARFSEHDNLYAHPLDFIPVVDANSEEVLHIDFPAHYKYSENGHILTVDSTKTTDVKDAESALGESKRERIPVPRQAYDFLPDLMAKTAETYKEPREGLKPLHVLQPEGVSFAVDGHEISWQKWKMHVSFSHREGIAISTVTYNDEGEVRPVFYRMSVAEMVVPYGAPEHPHARKFAFDSGEYGLGTMCNELSLGCDCLGQIHYLPGAFVNHDGSAFVIKNVICIHEEDQGVLWKHSDYRPGGRSQAVRRRRLAIQCTATLANYEYIWSYYFYQDGTVEFDVKLTGILQVYVSNDNEPHPYGTEVAPNVNAHYHQHMFSFRVDPMVDGIFNSVVEADVVPLPDTAGSDSNFAGNGFTVEETVLKNETSRPYDLQKERKWKIVNNGRKHYSTKKPAGYTFNMKSGVTNLMAKEGGWVATRATFATQPLWVCRADEGKDQSARMWPAGKYVPQTREPPEDSVGKWVSGKGKIEDEDILLYLTFGTTHIPRPEDWPVMPVEELSIMFKPVSFFKMNPSMDVPSANDPKSVPAFNEDGTRARGCCN